MYVYFCMYVHMYYSATDSVALHTHVFFFFFFCVTLSQQLKTTQKRQHKNGALLNYLSLSACTRIFALDYLISYFYFLFQFNDGFTSSLMLKPVILINNTRFGFFFINLLRYTGKSLSPFVSFFSINLSHLGTPANYSQLFLGI